jgi:hypothetical protein
LKTGGEPEYIPSCEKKNPVTLVTGPPVRERGAWAPHVLSAKVSGIFLSKETFSLSQKYISISEIEIEIEIENLDEMVICKYL